ncbi:hypothetical protein EJB05_47229 [Eragrostis curvula]|uniref:Uncharacterized protein n=1 Tax=Eragrostis curvula TaxID=38414 RepID=A0A5J9T723_9POAL|nr:hypothetical protein EJB05_47229 [Eragrostis curvula]
METKEIITKEQLSRDESYQYKSDLHHNTDGHAGYPCITVDPSMNDSIPSLTDPFKNHLEH